MAIVKVISHSPNAEQYQPDACIDILWPCERYTVTLLANDDCDLNFLESTVLQLCALGVTDKKQLQRLLGLENELVDFVCDKLEQLCLMSERMTISAEGETLLQKVKCQVASPVTVNIYWNKVTSQFLPMITPPSTILHCVNATSEKLSFSIGGIGKEQKIEAYHLQSKQRSVAPKDLLGERSVLGIIERFKILGRKKSSLTNIKSHRYPSQGQNINVTLEGENVFIHCLAFIPQGDNKPMVCDGFFSSYDADLTKAFRYENELVRILKNSKRKFTNKNSKIQAKKSKEKITLKDSYRYIMEEVSTDSFTRAELEDKKAKYITTVYSLIEEKFTALALESRPTNWSDYFTDQSYQNGIVLTEFAEQLGFVLTRDSNLKTVSDNKFVNSLLIVKIGSISHLSAAMPVMKPALALLLLAARLDDQYLFNAFVESHPNLFINLLKLHNDRNALSHGNLEVLDEISKDEFIGIHDLYLAIVGDENVEMSAGITNQPRWLQNDIRFQHREKLNRLFGHYLIGHVDETTLKLMEQALSSAKDNDGRQRVDALCSALQQSLFFYNSILISGDNEPKSASYYLEIIQKRWGSVQPQGLLKTAEDKIKSAANGVNSTLGANMIVYLSHETNHSTKALKQLDSNMVNRVSELIEIRGHGGKVLGKQKELDVLEKSTFKFIHFLQRELL